MARKFVVIPARCCNGNCNKPAITAQVMMDAWGSLCAECSKEGKFLLNTISIDKIMAAKEQTKTKFK